MKEKYLEEDIYLQKKGNKLLMNQDWQSNIIMEYQKNNKFVRQYNKSVI